MSSSPPTDFGFSALSLLKTFNCVDFLTLEFSYIGLTSCLACRDKKKTPPRLLVIPDDTRVRPYVCTAVPLEAPLAPQLPGAFPQFNTRKLRQLAN